MKNPMPTYNDKHRFAFGESTDTAQAQVLGESCLVQGRLYDALDFFRSANDSKAIDSIVESCVESGDIFLVKYALDTKGVQLSPQLADKIGDKALAQGKITFAKQAFAAAGSKEKLERIADGERQAREALLQQDQAENNTGNTEQDQVQGHL